MLTNPRNLICLVGFLDLFGVSMLIPLIQSHAKDLGASPSQAGLIGSFYGFLQLFSSPAVGKWSDIVGRRFALSVCLLVSGCGYVVLGLSSSILIMTLSRIPSGLFKHTQTISKSYLAAAVPDEERVSVYGHFNAISSIGFIIGPTVGGHLAESSSSGFFFVGLMAGIVFFISSLIIKFCVPELPLRQPMTKEETQNNRSPPNFSSILSVCKNVFISFTKVDWKNLWDLFLVNFLLGFAAIMLRANFTRMLIERYGTTPKVNGYVISSSGFVTTLFSFVVGYIAEFYKNDSKLFRHSAILNLCGLLGLAWAPDVVTFCILQIPVCLASSINRVVALNLVVNRSDRTETGGIMGLNQSLMAIARTLSPLLAGILLEIHPVGPYMGSCVFVSLAILIMITVSGGKKTNKDSVQNQDLIIKKKNM